MKIRNMLANDKFMSALGIAFIISFLCGMTDMLSKRYVSGTVSVIEGLADLFRNINACFYPSALAVVIIEWLHNNERLNLALEILTVLSLVFYILAKICTKVLYELDKCAQEFDIYSNIALGAYACLHILLIYKILYDGREDR